MKGVCTSLVLVLLVAGLALPAFGQAQQPQTTPEQQARLAEIDRYMQQQRQAAEQHYAMLLDEIGPAKRARLSALSAADNCKFVLGGFEGWAIYVEEVLKLSGVDLARDELYARTWCDFRGPGRTAVEQLDTTPRLLAIAETRLAEETARVDEFFSTDRVQLEAERRYVLDVRLPALEQKLKDAVLHPTEPTPKGKVTGIVYSDTGGSAIVGSQVVRQGDKIGDVQVRKVNADSVEFQDSAGRWTQQIGEAPASRW